MEAGVRAGCLSFFCPCVAFGQVAETIDKGVTLLLHAGVCLLHCIYSCSYRRKLRALYGLPAEPCADGCVHCFCEPCALSQMYRELKNRGADPANAEITETLQSFVGDGHVAVPLWLHAAEPGARARAGRSERRAPCHPRYARNATMVTLTMLALDCSGTPRMSVTQSYSIRPYACAAMSDTPEPELEAVAAVRRGQLTPGHALPHQAACPVCPCAAWVRLVSSAECGSRHLGPKRKARICSSYDVMRNGKEGKLAGEGKGESPHPETGAEKVGTWFGEARAVWPAPPPTPPEPPAPACRSEEGREDLVLGEGDGHKAQRKES
ncbi:hypothetical protein HU200_042109 [Digitaria exilis]|uniref:Uncharacterized protein n=1 Tax=Digitaria exilis TaxID=1010633 RepID=A0A835EIS3_9POAL|nr:hypothetical protein HU200_042109 [Digitaria exilis]